MRPPYLIGQAYLSHCKRALKDLDCIAVQIKAYQPVWRIVYDNVDWSAESRKLLRYSRDLRFEFRQFEPNSVERLSNIARACGSEVKIDTQQALDPSKRSDEDRLRPRSVGQGAQKRRARLSCAIRSAYSLNSCRVSSTAVSTR